MNVSMATSGPTVAAIFPSRAAATERTGNSVEKGQHGPHGAGSESRVAAFRPCNGSTLSRMCGFARLMVGSSVGKMGKVESNGQLRSGTREERSAFGHFNHHLAGQQRIRRNSWTAAEQDMGETRDVPRGVTPETQANNQRAAAKK